MGAVVRRYIDILTIIINFPYSTCISSFFGSSNPTSLLIFYCFVLVYVIFVQYIANVTQKNHSRSFKKSRTSNMRRRCVRAITCEVYTE